ncbi:MAG TPA: hypothetical protein PLV08_05320 [Flavobacteriales bacterium]|nr:hypothetical protein [Flavobacteriales bacterium]HQW98342.1 hypothetical protein [Flavobacteriales bacterium]HQX99176.1 hypothetical protein [Flavobacteriales bacterium]
MRRYPPGKKELTLDPFDAICFQQGNDQKAWKRKECPSPVRIK